MLEKWIEHGLRDVPTVLYPVRSETAEVPVTLTTPKAQEVFSYLRPRDMRSPPIPPEKDRELSDEMHPNDVEEGYPFYRPEPAQIFRRLPELKPPVLYIFGQYSELASAELRRKKIETTGVGVGGSGGVAQGKVKEVVLDCGHLVPMERVRECADAAATFTDEELGRWELATREGRKRWLEMPKTDRVGIGDEWMKMMGPRETRK